ncbi:Unannotated [Lentimonas sp. CC4]|nr:Unannotated [Lentimonas sp. CC4]CAA6683913.1 Unannotated [Lentimonas sp. CC6]CAA7076709.1 Unannotated [Lentimonas sp. CC4]CAA7169956.1 Unannotated [Lentimonas sp. CC21]CAA7181246.1 Unannotated [Lentimonas sp. CC8]
MCFRYKSVSVSIFIFILGSIVLYGANDLEALEKRQDAMNEQLSALAQPTLNMAVGQIGFRSLYHRKKTEPLEWIQVDLEKPVTVDEIVLVPVVSRMFSLGVVADAFPVDFKVFVGSSPDGPRQLVAEFNGWTSEQMGIAPVIIDFAPQLVSWVRVEATRLSQKVSVNDYYFQLAEMMVFGGGINYALGATATSSSTAEESAAWSVSYLVDGVLPYIMDSASERQSAAFLSVWLRQDFKDDMIIDIDLEAPVRVTGLRMFSIDQNETFPHSHPGDFGFPRKFRVLASNRADFTESEVLFDVSFNKTSEISPIMEWRRPGKSCRYLRIVIDEPYSEFLKNRTLRRIALSEIEVLSDGRNIALNKPVKTNLDYNKRYSAVSALTDGMNSFGEILTIRRWMNELALRHTLAQELLIVEDGITQAHLDQEVMLRRMLTVVVTVAAVMVLLFLIVLIRRQAHEAHIRERIAANLHDELGANLHAIGMLGDVAIEALDSPDRLKIAVRKIRELTDRTGQSVRQCTNMMQAKGADMDFVQEVKSDSARLLSGIEAELEVEDAVTLNALPRRKRIDLSLFHKECLMNIIKHADATKVTESIRVEDGTVIMTVLDNGMGLGEKVPLALSRRARLVGGKLEILSPSDGGTKVVLKVTIPKIKILR